MSDDWQVVEEALTDWSRDTREWKLNVGDVGAALARLREREAQLACAEKDYEAMYDQAAKAEARVARLEEALREVAGKIAPIGSAGKEVREIIATALAHEEDK